MRPNVAELEDNFSTDNRILSSCFCYERVFFNPNTSGYFQDKWEVCFETDEDNNFFLLAMPEYLVGVFNESNLP